MCTVQYSTHSIKHDFMTWFGDFCFFLDEKKISIFAVLSAHIYLFWYFEYHDSCWTDAAKFDQKKNTITNNWQTR